MSRSTILVPLDPDATEHGQIGWAAALAARLEGRLLGIAISDLRLNVHRGMAPKAAAQGLEQERARQEARLASLGETFLAQAGEGAEWRGMIGDAESSLPLHARAADLIAIGGTGNPEDIGALILEVGRPVLLAGEGLPPMGWSAAIVAWKDTREARRAIADALPVLRLYREVRVVAAIEAEAAAAREGSADVAAWLQRHGVPARAEQVEPEDGKVGPALLHAANAAGADLIVSGAYSRGPLRQRVFGGMTTSLLGHGALHRLLSY